MKYYTVKALSVGGRKKVFKSGDLVNESNFPEGMAEKLVKQGFLVPYDEDVNEKVPHQSTDEVETEVTVIEKEESEADTVEGQDKQEEESEAGEKDESQEGEEEDLTRNEIMKELTAMEVKFNKNASKAELYELWKTAMKK